MPAHNRHNLTLSNAMLSSITMYKHVVILLKIYVNKYAADMSNSCTFYPIPINNMVK